MTKIYCVDCDSLTDSDIDQLSSYRKEKANRYAFSKDRKLCLAAGVALNRALNEYHLNEADVIINYTELHKPYLKDYPNIHFNLSHSGKKAICVISDKEIGCDIEQILDMKKEISERCFSKEEQEYIDNSNDKTEAFYRIWVAKESFLKAIGTGINENIKRFSVIPYSNGIQLTQDIDGRTWAIKETRIDDYVYAVCEEK